MKAINTRLKLAIREPLVYFLLAGAALFVLYEMTASSSFEQSLGSEEIVVSQNQLDVLIDRFEKVWRRSPSQKEFDDLVEDFVHEEVLYREALALGLDRNDSIVRQRMRQKMEFVSEDLSPLVEPRDQELQTFLENNADLFKTDASFTFQQIFVDPKNHSKADIQELLNKLKNHKEPDDLPSSGDLLSINRDYDKTPLPKIQKLFGHEFAAHLNESLVDCWLGPIPSGYGFHLIRISEKRAPTLPVLADIKEKVLLEWTNIKQKEANESLYQSLRSHYKITVLPPSADNNSLL